MDTKQSEPNRAIYVLLALMIIVFTAGIWIIRRNINRAISPPPTSLETDGAGPRRSVTPTALESALTNPRPGMTNTPTEFIPMIIIQVDQADVRSGPDPIFPLLIQVKNGLALRAVGRNAENTYLLILLPDNRQGWIPVEVAMFDFDLQLLPIVIPPPTPTFTPTPTPQPAPDATPGMPAPTRDTGPYGQGILAPPQIPGIAPISQGNPGRRALGLISAMLLSMLMLSQRGWATNLIRPIKPVLTRLAQALSALL